MKRLALFILIAAAAVGCKKEYKSIYTFVDKTNKAKVKFVHTVANAYPLPDTVTQGGLQLYVNGNKITGATNVTYGGGVFPGLEYSLVPAGDVNLKAVIPAGTNNPAIPVLDATLKVEDQKTYTAFMVDSLPTTSVFLIEEKFSQIADSGKYFIRLVNATMGAPALDLYGTTDATLMASAIPYKAASEFKQIFVGTGARAFALRLPGSTVNLGTSSITPVAGRMYTLLTYGVIGKGGTRNPRITFYTSRFQTYEF